MQKNFKEMVKRDERLPGTWAQMASSETVEMVGQKNYLFLSVALHRV